jgi:Zn finger protein HypA/HybF involved in hydrogenase expression
MKTTKSVVCPDCEEEIDFSHSPPKEGLRFTCPHCETSLQIVSVNPLEVDWDDSDFFDDDFDSDEVWE